MLELQGDWALRDTYDAVMGIVKTRYGAYGVGVDTHTRCCMAFHRQGCRSTSFRSPYRMNSRSLAHAATSLFGFPN